MVRVKYRHIIGQIIVDNFNLSKQEDLNSKELLASIKDKINVLFGEIGNGCISTNLTLKYYDPLSRIFVLRILRDSVKDVWFTMTLMTDIKKVQCCIRCLNVSSCERTLSFDLKTYLSAFAMHHPNWSEVERKEKTDEYCSQIDLLLNK